MFDRLIASAQRREPDFKIGPPDDPYLRRWWIIPRNKIFNIYLHEIRHDDEDRACHDHPWWNVSIILRGEYRELIEKPLRGGGVAHRWNARVAGSVVFRSAKARHRLALSRNGLLEAMPCWSLFITGPRIRNWGFHCPKGFVPWERFVAPNNKGEVGPGCEG